MMLAKAQQSIQIKLYIFQLIKFNNKQYKSAYNYIALLYQMFYSSDQQQPKGDNKESDWEQQLKEKKKTIKKKNRGNKNKNKIKMISSTYRKQKCQFYNKGNCTKGNQCTYNHDFQPDTNRKICKYFLAGACTKENSCQYSHNTKVYPCKFYHIDNQCQFTNNCRFSHEQIAQDFYEEYMKDNKDHILKAYKDNKLQNQNLIQYIKDQIPKKQLALPLIVPLMLPEIVPNKNEKQKEQISGKRQINMMWIDSSKKDPRQKFVKKLIPQAAQQIQAPKMNLIHLNKPNTLIKEQQIIKKENNIREIFIAQLKSYFNRYY